MSTHETAQRRISSLIEKGEAEKVQWSELLAALSQLSSGRIKTAMSELTPAQLMALREGANSALEQSKITQMRNLQLRLAHEGITHDEFFAFLQSVPAQQESQKSKTRKTLTREQYADREERIRKLLSNGTDSIKDIHEELLRAGIEGSYASVAAVTKKIREELSEAA